MRKLEFLNIGLDLRIGTSPALEHRVARLAHTSKFAAAREILEYPVILKFLWNMFGASQNNFFWNAINRRNSQSQQLLNKITSNFAWLGNVSFSVKKFLGHH